MPGTMNFTRKHLGSILNVNSGNVAANIANRLEAGRVVVKPFVFGSGSVDIVAQTVNRRKLKLAQTNRFQVAIGLDNERVALGAGTRQVHHRRIPVLVGRVLLVDRTSQVVGLCNPSQVGVRGIGSNLPGVLEIPTLVVFLPDHLMRGTEFACRGRGDKPQRTVVVSRCVSRLYIFACEAAKLGCSRDIACTIGILHYRVIGVARQSADILCSRNRSKRVAIRYDSLIKATHKATHILRSRNGVSRRTQGNGARSLLADNAANIVFTQNPVLHINFFYCGSVIDTGNGSDIVLAADNSLDGTRTVRVVFPKIRSRIKDNAAHLGATSQRTEQAHRILVGTVDIQARNNLVVAIERTAEFANRLEALAHGTVGIAVFLRRKRCIDVTHHLVMLVKAVFVLADILEVVVIVNLVGIRSRSGAGEHIHRTVVFERARQYRVHALEVRVRNAFLDLPDRSKIVAIVRRLLQHLRSRLATSVNTCNSTVKETCSVIYYITTEAPENPLGSVIGCLDHACRISAMDIRPSFIAVVITIADNATDIFETLDNINRERVVHLSAAPHVADNAADTFRALDLSGRPDNFHSAGDKGTRQATHGVFASDITVHPS